MACNNVKCTFYLYVTPPNSQHSYRMKSLYLLVYQENLHHNLETKLMSTFRLEMIAETNNWK